METRQSKISHESLMPVPVMNNHLMQSQHQFETELMQLGLPMHVIQAAIDARGEVFNYGMYKVFTVMSGVAFLKQVYAASGLSPEIEMWLAQWTQQYLSDMSYISAVAMEKMIVALHEYDPHANGRDGLARFIDYISGFFRE